MYKQDDDYAEFQVSYLEECLDELEELRNEYIVDSKPWCVLDGAMKLVQLKIKSYGV